MMQENIHKSFSVSTPAQLKVTNIRGSILIRQGDGNRIEVKAIKNVDSPFPEDTVIEISQTDDRTVNVHTRYVHGNIFSIGKPCKVEYEILAPQNTSTQINSVSGSIMVGGVEGNHRIKSVSGGVEIDQISGDVKINSVSGRIFGKRITGPAVYKTTSGAIRIEESSHSTIQSSTVSGRMIIHSDIGDGPYQFTSVSGPINLIVPNNTKCSVKAQSVSSRFLTDFKISSNYSKPNSWNIDIAGGGTNIYLKSVSGKLSVLTSENAIGEAPSSKPKSHVLRMDILRKLEDGEFSVEETLAELN